MMRAYYDMEAQDQFDTLFDGMWIKEHPTELKGKFQVVYLDFSQAVSGLDNMEEQFHKYCALKLNSFAETYAKYYGDDFAAMVKSLFPDTHSQMVYICDEAKKRGIPLYLILDEYDNFTNDVLSEKQQSLIRRLATEGTVITSFPAERIYDKKNFVSLLYYYGMLTIGGGGEPMGGSHSADTPLCHRP